MILAVDVHYLEAQDAARAGGVLFGQWSDETASGQITHVHRGLADYVPGQFFRRELPCILPLVREAEQRSALSAVVVDGFVDLDGGPGLGRHLFNVLGRTIPVVGVAKTAFPGAPALAVTRGHSAKPLWVSATGDLAAAAAHIRSMAGRGRIPTLLRAADRLARGL